MRPLHPDAERLLAMMRDAGRPALDTLSPVEARRAYAASRAILQAPPEATDEARDLAIPGPAGALRLRLYRGAGTAAAGALPCLLYLHGGGWVLGDLDSHDALCRKLANAAACWVVAVDYRLAPEHPFPGAVEDAAAALAWVADQATALGMDPARIAVGGDSAGGNLAAVLALMGRDGTAPATVFQLLFYPVLDLAMTSDGYQLALGDLPLTAPTMRYFVDHYAPEAGQRLDWRASPLRAASLAGAPPALVVTAAHDPLCAEGRTYAERLETEGVRVTAMHLSDQVHGLLTMDGVIGAADRLVRFAGAALRDAWCFA